MALKTPDEHRIDSESWTLASDASLLQTLKSGSNGLLESAANIKNQLNSLLDIVEKASTTLGNTQNKLVALSSSQFIERRVYDEDVPRLRKEQLNSSSKKAEKTKEEKESEMTESVKIAIRAGCGVLKTHFRKLEVRPEDLDEVDDPTFRPEPIFEPSDPYVERPLPFIIGSREFEHWDHIGLSRKFLSQTEQENDTKEELVLSVTEPITRVSEPVPTSIAPATSDSSGMGPSSGDSSRSGEEPGLFHDSYISNKQEDERVRKTAEAPDLAKVLAGSSGPKPVKVLPTRSPANGDSEDEDDGDLFSPPPLRAEPKRPAPAVGGSNVPGFEIKTGGLFDESDEEDIFSFAKPKPGVRASTTVLPASDSPSLEKTGGKTIPKLEPKQSLLSDTDILTEGYPSASPSKAFAGVKVLPTPKERSRLDEEETASGSTTEEKQNPKVSHQNESPCETSKTKVEPTPPRTSKASATIKSADLFGSESDEDDIFGTVQTRNTASSKPKDIKPEINPVQTGAVPKLQPPKTTKKLDDLFDDESGEEDIFSFAPKKTSFANPVSNKKTLLFDDEDDDDKTVPVTSNTQKSIKPTARPESTKNKDPAPIATEKKEENLNSASKEAPKIAEAIVPNVGKISENEAQVSAEIETTKVVEKAKSESRTEAQNALASVMLAGLQRNIAKSPPKKRTAVVDEDEKVAEVEKVEKEVEKTEQEDVLQRSEQSGDPISQNHTLLPSLLKDRPRIQSSRRRPSRKFPAQSNSFEDSASARSTPREDDFEEDLPAPSFFPSSDQPGNEGKKDFLIGVKKHQTKKEHEEIKVPEKHYEIEDRESAEKNLLAPEAKVFSGDFKGKSDIKKATEHVPENRSVQAPSDDPFGVAVISNTTKIEEVPQQHPPRSVAKTDPFSDSSRPKATAKPETSLFSEEDSDEDLFGSITAKKPAVRTELEKKPEKSNPPSASNTTQKLVSTSTKTVKKTSLFDEDSDSEDIFATSKPNKILKFSSGASQNAPSNRVPRTETFPKTVTATKKSSVAKKSIFDDDSDDDIFK